jgi:hypothetical protein
LEVGYAWATAAIAFEGEGMAIREYVAEMGSVRDDIHELKSERGRPARGAAIAGFFERAASAGRLIFIERELIVFALLQWLVIALGYYLWVEMLAWIPDEVWASVEDSDEGSVADIILLLWSLVVVGLVAFPLGILSACMGAVHFLHRQGERSTIARCLRLVLPNAWPIWIFSWVDGWWTVMRILDRLPRRNDSRTRAEKLRSEALFQAWKLGTLGILPALTLGKGLIESGRQSVKFVGARFGEVAILRFGYSALCWIVGIAAYFLTIVFLTTGPGSFVPDAESARFIYLFYFWAGVPIVIAAGVVMLVLRPLYLLSACELYSDFLEERGETVDLADPPPKSVSALVGVAVLGLVVLVVFLFRDSLGITDLLSTPYQ